MSWGLVKQLVTSEMQKMEINPEKVLCCEDFNSFTGKRWEHKLLVVCRNLPLFFPTNAIPWKKWNVNKTTKQTLQALDCIWSAAHFAIKAFGPMGCLVTSSSCRWLGDVSVRQLLEKWKKSLKRLRRASWGWRSKDFTCHFCRGVFGSFWFQVI